jgi:predicted CXXCH cytochrome family protein
MKTKVSSKALWRWLGLAAALMVSGSALAASGITTTKHNLSATGGTGSTNKFSGTEQICVFCHTPHASDADNSHPPLWNRTMPASNTFTTYDSLGTTTLQGKVLGVGSISLACLSCHDGSQAMNVGLKNDPGSGASNATFQAGTWSGSNGTGKPVGPALLGTNLKDDHPVGVEYCGGGITANATTGVLSGSCNNTEFIGATSTTTGDGRTAQLTGGKINNVAAVWVDVDGTAGSRGKGDIRLYIRDFTGVSGTSASTPSVECGSCHDPHLESTGTNNVAFMRVTPDGSKICLSCHVK